MICYTHNPILIIKALIIVEPLWQPLYRNPILYPILIIKATIQYHSPRRTEVGNVVWAFLFQLAES